MHSNSTLFRQRARRRWQDGIVPGLWWPCAP